MLHTDRMRINDRKTEYSEQTRRDLLQVARVFFTEQGYARTVIEEIVLRAGVTRGALYYHFQDKKDLFRAVFEEVEQELMQKVIASADLALPGPWERVRAGFHAFLDASLEPSAQRIVMLDAPSVLGWTTWREIETKYCFGLLCSGLSMAMEAGLIELQPVGLLARLLMGALNEGAMLIARAEDRESARAEVGTSIDRLLNGLKTA